MICFPKKSLPLTTILAEKPGKTLAVAALILPASRDASNEPINGESAGLLCGERCNARCGDLLTLLLADDEREAFRVCVIGVVGSLLLDE